jgi:hypothetical protein
MCEYCGCQAIAAIDELTREHDRVVDLIGAARAARDDAPALAALAGQILAILGPHTRVEEEGLFRALAADFADHVAALRAEHGDIEAALAEAASGNAQNLQPALDRLREHILKEQDGVFPAALTTLRTEDWDVVDKVRAGQSSVYRAKRG